jgi:hypothetical protein
MKYCRFVASSLPILVPLAVHASTKVSERNEIVTEWLPKPAHIRVVATPRPYGRFPLDEADSTLTKFRRDVSRTTTSHSVVAPPRAVGINWAT